MPESKRHWLHIGAATLAGVVLTLLLGIDAWPVALAGALAQPGFALAVSWWRGTRTSPRWPRDAMALAGAWVAGLAVVAVLVAWPLAALRETGSLSAAIGLSIVAGVALLLLWRTWPVWHALEREGGPMAALWRVLGEVEIGAWRGLGVAAIVAALSGTVLALAWPGLVPANLRWPVVIALVVAAPLLHFLLQRVHAASPLPIETQLAAFEAQDEAVDDERPGEDLDVALYSAARSGRVDRALALLDGGANAHAFPPPNERDQRTLPMLAAILPDLRLLRALIQHGVDLNAAHGGMAPLLSATRDSWHGRPEAVMTLLANGADPRIADNDGNTPLHHAARSSDPGVAALLRDAAGDIDAINRDGFTRWASRAPRATGAWRASCSSAARKPNCRTPPLPCSPPRARRKTTLQACSCCSSTRPRWTRATHAIAAHCTKPRAAATSRSSACCSPPAPTCTHATSTAARRGSMRRAVGIWKCSNVCCRIAPKSRSPTMTAAMP
jgi:hypothetical protein